MRYSLGVAMNSTTLNQLLLHGIQSQNKPELLWHKHGGAWRPISARTFLRRVASLAWALKEMGIRKGDRVAIFSENRPEWHIADLACLGQGIITVPLYQADSVERVQYILRDSGARLCFVSGQEQLEKVQAAWKELPQLETVVPFAGPPDGAPESHGRVVPWEELARDDAREAMVVEFEYRARLQAGDDVATLIYTSGTTGQPKGALLTQHNFASNITSYTGDLFYGPGDLALSVLPLCHIYERTLAYGRLVHGVSVAYAESIEKVVENMREVRPTLMTVVPRFFEKFYTRLMEAVQVAPAPKRKLFDWGVCVGRAATPYRLGGRPMPAGLALRYRLADFLVYRKIRKQLGGRIRFFGSGGAPLSRELNEFFHAVGLTIYEGYGLTETSPVIAANVPGAVKLGTVGKPIPGVEVKIAEDGEILTRGPHVMKGYYKMEEETREALRDGWFHTGDIGFLDEDGFLTITDRKKDLIKTAGGKMIAPQMIENRLRARPYIENAVALGDRRKYVVALLVPQFAALEQYAAEQGISFSSRADLLAKPAIQTLLEAEVEAVNRDLAQFERIKRFALLDREFTFADGDLTYTQKVRRRKIEEHYHRLIEHLYEKEVVATS